MLKVKDFSMLQERQYERFRASGRDISGWGGEQKKHKKHHKPRAGQKAIEL